MVLGFAGWSGSGKTTLIKNIIPYLNRLNISVSTLKHAHEGFDIDQPGKDSFVHREAGAKEVLISSNKRFALMHEYKEAEMRLSNLLKKLQPVDLILVEGWKSEKHRKIEVFRSCINKPLLCEKDNNIIAIATDNINLNYPGKKILNLNDYNSISLFIKSLLKENS
tara:strand:- start:9418 stop:9915 length:498 start_codon:yes stop_codon:yes gene_type:complete